MRANPLPSRGLKLVPVGLIVLTLAALRRLAGAEFLSWDDYYTVALNPAINRTGMPDFLWAWTTPFMGLYIPITYSFWMLLSPLGYVAQPDAVGSHLNSWIFHAANVLLHCANVLLVYRLLGLLTRRDGRPSNPWPAALGAAVFAVHPLQVESVAWISGAKDLLSFTLGLSALLVHLSAMRGRKWMSALLLATALLAKPSAMIWPLLAVEVDGLCRRRNWKQMASDLWPWVAVALPAAIVAKLVQPAVGVDSVLWWRRPLVAAFSLVFYLYKLLWPVNLTIDYGMTPQWILSHVPVAALAGCALLVLLGAAGFFWLRNRRPLAALAIGWMVVALLPVLGFTRFLFQFYSTVADHYMYPAMAAAALAVAAIVGRAGGVGRAMALMVIFLLAAQSFRQAGFWADDSTLYAHALSLNQHSLPVLTNLGTQALGRGDLRAAEQWYLRAVEVRPTYPKARQKLAQIYILQRRYDQAVEQLQLIQQTQSRWPASVQMDTDELARLLKELKDRH